MAGFLLSLTDAQMTELLLGYLPAVLADQAGGTQQRTSRLRRNAADSVLAVADT